MHVRNAFNTLVNLTKINFLRLAIRNQTNQMLFSCYYAFSSQCDLVQDVTMDLIFLYYVISRKHFAITCVAGFSKLTTGK